MGWDDHLKLDDNDEKFLSTLICSSPRICIIFCCTQERLIELHQQIQKCGLLGAASSHYQVDEWMNRLVTLNIKIGTYNTGLYCVLEKEGT